MNIFLLLSLILPLGTAILLMALRRRPQLQANLNVVGSALHFGAAVGLLMSVWQSGVVATQLGDWAAPFGITLVADIFSALMVVLTGLMGLLVAIYSLSSMSDQEIKFGYYPLVQLLLMGVCGAFLTGDMFNLYVWFEMLLITSFVLLILGGSKDQIEGAVKYVIINLVASVLFLSAIGILYGMTGTLNMADLSQKLDGLPVGLVTTLSMLFLIAFGIKSGIFPLFFWLPASYHTAPAAIIAIFAGLLTKVGVYSLVRVFTLLFDQDESYTHWLILVIAGLTMVTGVLGAVAQMEIRKLLSFHIISQIGYLLMGLGLFSVSGLAATIFFMAHVIVAKSALFLVGGVIYKLQGTYDLKKLGGLYVASPTLSVLFLIPALSLAGIPPFSGFWAKFALVEAGLDLEQYIIVATSLGVSVLTLYSMTKIWAEAFWKDSPVEREVEPITAKGKQNWLPYLIPIGTMAVILIFMGLSAEPMVNLSLQAAEQLMSPTDYVETVLGGRS